MTKPRSSTVAPQSQTTISRNSGLIALDSSCWLEYFMDSDRAVLYASAVSKTERLIVPLITVYEVYKKLRRELSDMIAREAVGLMRQGQLIEADLTITLAAAAHTELAMADSLIYATAQHHSALVWTQDAHFQKLPGVKFFPKSSAH
jgi:predicted nucleic acid-binding protein